MAVVTMCGQPTTARYVRRLSPSHFRTCAGVCTNGTLDPKKY